MYLDMKFVSIRQECKNLIPNSLNFIEFINNIDYKYIEAKYPEGPLILSCPNPSLSQPLPLPPFPCLSCLLAEGVVYSVSFIDAHHVRERGLRD